MKGKTIKAKNNISKTYWYMFLVSMSPINCSIDEFSEHLLLSKRKKQKKRTSHAGFEEKTASHARFFSLDLCSSF